MCERARKKGVTPQNIKAAWTKCGIHPFNKIRVTTNPQYTLLIRAQSESPPLREGLQPQQKSPTTVEIEKISATKPTPIEEAQPLLSKMGEIATREALRTYQLEAQLAVAQQELHQAFAREVSEEKSRKVLSSARYITEGDLQTARHGQEEPTIEPKRKRTQKAGREPSTKRGGQKHQVRDEDVIGAQDSEVERQVQAMMMEDEDGVEEDSEHEKPPLHEISEDIMQTTRWQAPATSATTKGRSSMRGRGERKGKAVVS